MRIAASKYSTSVALSAYELARDGQSDASIAKALGITAQTFSRWLKSKAEFREFLERARQFKPRVDGVREFVFARLSPEAQEAWERVCLRAEADGSEEAAERLTAPPTETEQQLAYVYALVHNNFNVAQACRSVGIPRRLPGEWAKSLEFAELLQELEVAKDDFYQTSFDAGIARGEPTLLVHAAKTRLRHRGFGEVKGIEVSGKVQHTHSDFSLQPVLDRVSVQARREFLAALEAIEAEKEGVPAPAGNTLPAPSPSREVVEAEVISGD